MRPEDTLTTITSPASRDALIRLAEAWIREGWQHRNLQTFDRLHAANFVDRSPAGRAPTLDGLTAGIAELYAAFPDFHAEIDDLVIDPAQGKVAIRWTATGTHEGPFLGCPPTGHRIRFTGIEILRVRDNQIVERWGEWDGP